MQRSAGGVATSYPAPAVLLVAPPPLAPQTLFAEVFAGGEAKAHKLAPAYRKIAKAAGVAFFDAATVVATEGNDAIHLTEASQRKLRQALATKVSELLD